MMESQKYAIVDLETTGHSPANGDRMIQIAIVIMKDWEVERTYTKFINPGKAIPTFIQDLTHITNEDVKDSYPFEEHADYIYELLADCVFVAHNADFDLSFLQAEFKRAGLPKLDGGVCHPYRRKWATERKDRSIKDVAAAGGWKDLETLATCYQQEDRDTMLAVMSETKKLSDAVIVGRK